MLPVCFIVLLISTTPPLQAHDGPGIKAQRTLFIKVESALKVGDRSLFKRHRKSLADYPLYPYLLHQDLSHRLARADEDEIADFLRAYGGKTPVAEKLRHRWLEQLAHRGRWGMFLEHHAESVNIENKDNLCRYAYALIHAGRVSEAKELVRSLWLVDFSQPPPCDPALKWGFDQSVIDDALIWSRALLVSERGERGLMNYLGSRLQGDARRWFEELKRARQRPEIVAFEMRGHVAASRYAGDVMRFALRRLAARDVARAGQVWGRIKRGCDECLALRMIEKEIGIASAQHLLPAEAYRWLSQLPLEYRDTESRRWRIRAALRMKYWRGVLAGVDDLQGEERVAPQWRYWRARALAALGHNGEARGIWEQLAQSDNYYGYLSADRLGKSYPHALIPLEITKAGLAELDAYPAVVRMHELWLLKRPFDANRELIALLKRVDAGTRLRIAAVAYRWHWPAGAIYSLSSSNAGGHFLQRFPMPYRDIVEVEARRNNVPAEWIYGIMRRESIFVEQIKSSAGALGLMQLRPRTAHAVASRLGLGRVSNRKILSPKTNIRLGTAYIRQLHRRSDDRFPVSLAGYNAGPSNARKWLNSAPVSEGAVWIDTIPFRETRQYVRAVLFYTLVYRHRLGKPPVRLRDLIGF